MTTFALAGAGWITAVHGLAIAALGDTVTAVASRTEASAAQRVAQTGGRVVRYDDLPAGADVVVVATPPDRHATDALRAMAAGAVALVEKPLCTTLDDADRLVRVVEAGGRLVYAENLLFADAVGTALAEIARLGPLVNLSARALQPRPTWGSFTERAWGGGVAFDLGVHPLALVLRAASADPVAVRATYESSPDIAVEDHAVLDVRFSSGLTTRVESSWCHETPTWDLQAASADGVVRLDLLPDLSLERDGDPVALAPPAVPAAGSTLDAIPPQLDQFGYVDQLRAATSAVGGTPSTISDVHLGRRVLEVVCAAAESARTGDEVALPYTGPRDRTPVEIWDPRTT